MKLKEIILKNRNAKFAPPNCIDIILNNLNAGSTLIVVEENISS